MKVVTRGGEGLLEGTGIGLFNKYVTGPLARVIGEKVYGSDTPESIAASTASTANSAEKTAADSVAAAQARAEQAKQALQNVPLNRADLGFQYTQGPLANVQNPTYAQLQAELDNMAKMKQADDPAGGVPILSRRINQAIEASPEVGMARATAADTAAQAQAATTTPDPTALAARARASAAQQLADWNWQADVRGMNVPQQALDALKQQYPNLSQAEREAYAKIANTAVNGPVSSVREMIGAGIGGQLGRLGEATFGALGVPAPFLREIVTYAGTKAAGMGVGEGAQQTQQAILNAYPALTGATPGALQAGIMSDQARQALTNLMMGGVGYSGY